MPAVAMVQQPFGHTLVNRIKPLMPAHAYKTYGMSMPLRTHWRPATCEEVDCEQWRLGWASTVDVSTELGQAQAHYMRHDKTRRCTEQQDMPGLITFVFGPGQRCFKASEHRVKIGRPPRFVVTGGDWRGNPRGEVRVHQTAQDWCEDFTEHQDRITAAIERG